MRLKQIFSTKKILKCTLFAVIPASLFYIFSLIVLKLIGFNLVEVLRDPAQQSGQSSFLGFLSNIGVWIWISAAAICIFSAINFSLEFKGRRRNLLFLVGALSIFIAVDDFFLIHDRYINEKLCYFVYAVLAVTLLVRHYNEIIKIDISSFLLAGLLLALSILVDLVQRYIPLPYGYIQVVEEGFKFTGAATWLYFSCRIASLHSKSFTERNN